MQITKALRIGVTFNPKMLFFGMYRAGDETHFVRANFAAPPLFWFVSVTHLAFFGFVLTIFWRVGDLENEQIEVESQRF